MKATEGSAAPGTPDATAVKWFGLDPDFRANWANARAAGLVRGAYHFGRPDLGNTPEAEANWFWSVVGAHLEPGDIIALDLESGLADLHVWTARFLARLRVLAGFNPMLYASPSFLAAHDINKANVGGDYGLWEAFWTSKMPAPAAGWPFIAIWQYGSGGVLAGIAGRVDGDLFNGDRATLQRYGKPGANSAGSGSITPPAPKPVPVPTPPPARLPGADPNTIEDRGHVAQEGNAAAQGASMATDPTPPAVPVPDVPEPAVVAEAGVSTSEWKLAVGFLTQAFAGVTLDAVNTVAGSVFHASVTVPPALLDLAVKLEWAGAVVAGSYIVSRGVRKLYAK